MPPGGRSILRELFPVVAADIAGLFMLPEAGTNLVPVDACGDPSLVAAVAEVARTFGIAPDVFVGDEVWGGMVVVTHPKPSVTIRRDLAACDDAERRFLVGRAFDSIRETYAPLMRLSARERADVGALLRALLVPEADRPDTAREFVAKLPRKTQRALERFVGTVGPPPDTDSWMTALVLAQDRAGLVACDDIGAAIRMLARLNGEELAVTPDGAVAPGSVPGGMELVRYYLSDEYHRIDETLTAGGRKR